jgi:hypothetical protein
MSDTTTGTSSTPSFVRGTRAPQACQRCRQKKMRCTGGKPCVKCLRASEACIFEHRINEPGHDDGIAKEHDAATRIAQLEKTLSSLVHGLPINEPTTITITAKSVTPVSPIPLQSPPHRIAARPGDAGQPIVLTAAGSNPLLELDSLPYSAPSAIPFQLPSQLPSPFGHMVDTPTVLADPSSVTPTSTAKKTSPEDPQSRLETAATGYAPFQPLTYHPSYWENRETSRPTSPKPEDAVPVFEARAAVNDDPISLGWVNGASGEALVDL